MVVCLTSIRMNMKADVLHQESATPNTPQVPGELMTVAQDPDSGEIVRQWTPNSDIDLDDPTHETTFGTFPCLARGIIDGGIRVAGTTERFDDVYEGVDYVRIWFPSSVKLSRRDRVTNIRDRNGNIIWREEERGDWAPTIFSVNGVTPILDYMGRHIENMALLERVGVQ